MDNLGKGLNRYQANQNAFKETPVPEVPDFYSQQAANPQPLPANGAAAVVPTPASVGAPPTITSQQQYDALPAGASYLDSRGTPHVKGGKRG